MQYRTDNKSGRELSALGFGCMRFPRNARGFDLEKSRELVEHAIANGVNYFDTAYVYSNSENVLGEILAANNLREKVFIATKLPLTIVKRREDFDKFLDRQLKRLKTDHIDYYLLHMLTDFEHWEQFKRMGIEEWLQKRKQAGDIRAVGFSYHGGRDAFPLIIDDYDWDLTQIQYNYLDEYAQAGRSGLEHAQKKGVPVVVMEPLRGGRLAAGLPKAAQTAFEQVGIAPADAALRWVWNHPGVTVTLSGMNDMKQLGGNLQTAEIALPDSLSPQIAAAVETAKIAIGEKIKVPCTGCNYCMPCPQGVDIPGCFAAYNSKYTMGMVTGYKQYLMNTNSFGKTRHWASRCVACGKCEKHCPQSIAISKELSRVKTVMEPWWLKAAANLMRNLTKSKD
jgi:predicted aldo/keto reductase-like oxidoreductase